jgi:hypothetical protein
LGLYFLPAISEDVAELFHSQTINNKGKKIQHQKPKFDVHIDSLIVGLFLLRAQCQIESHIGTVRFGYV